MEKIFLLTLLSIIITIALGSFGCDARTVTEACAAIDLVIINIKALNWFILYYEILLTSILSQNDDLFFSLHVDEIVSALHVMYVAKNFKTLRKYTSHMSYKKIYS